MNRFFIFFLLLLSSKESFAQCQNPMNDNTFGQIHAAVASMQSNKDATIRNISSTNCLTTNQIGLFSVLYGSDVEKYNYFLFAKPYCSDPQNYINLVTKLNEPVWKQQFVTASTTTAQTQNNTNNSQTQQTNQPVRSAPIVVNPNPQPIVNPAQQTQNNNQNQQNNQSSTPANQPVVYVPGYQGSIGCPVPVSQNDFNVINQYVANKTFDSDRLNAFKQSTQGKCLSVQQIRTLLKYFPHESSKLDAAKSILASTHDIENYIHISDEFTFSSNKDEILKHYLTNSHTLHKKKNKLNHAAMHNYHGRVGCSDLMTAHDFELILRASANETFDSKKVPLLKTIISNRCVSVHQIEKISATISADSYKMEFFKFIYLQTYDVDNFPRLESNLINSSYKNEFKSILR
jgi:hypothetical protein